MAVAFDLGTKLLFVDLKVALRPNQEVPPEITLPALELDSRLVQAGLAATYDSRDNSLNPRNGLFGNATLMFGTKSLGGNFTNQRFNLAGNIYRSLGEGTVFAARL